MLPNSQSDLLSTAKLRLNQKLRQSQPEAKYVVIRSPGGSQRLVVTPAQATILAVGFSEPKTVPEVLARLVGENRCPPLIVFYELVLKAYDAGVLVTGFEPTEYSLAVDWMVRLPVRLCLVVGTFVSSLSVLGLLIFLRRWHQPPGWLELAGGWLVACMLVSLGEVLAACAIAGSGGEVRGNQFFRQTIFPHFKTDTAEAVMGGRACEMAVGLLRLAPVAVGAILLVWKLPDFFAPVLAALLYVLGPWKQSAAMQWLSGRFGDPKFSVGSSHLFEPMRDDHWLQWSAKWRELKSKFGVLWFAWTIAWIGALAMAIARCLPGAAAAVPTWFSSTGRARPLLEVSFYSVIAAVVIGAFSAIWAAFKHWRIRREWRKPMRGVDAREKEREDLKGDLRDVLKQIPLFNTLEDNDVDSLAALLEPVQFQKGQWVFREEDLGDAFYLIREGELEVLKRLPNGQRKATIGWMGPGDCFGEIALLDNTPRSASIRASRNSVLLRLGRKEFERLVLGRVGGAKLREQLQPVRYLGRLTFMAGWPVSDLVDFARRCNSVRFQAGAVVLRRGEPNQFFYLIFDGWFEARDGGRVLRRMGPGDYFGEISLLENWQATADVVALEEGRCLTMARADFLALFTRGFRIALKMEAIAGQRLGTDVFISR